MKKLSFAFIMVWALIQTAIGQSSGTVKDADGNTYNTVRIGDQLWMAENLHTTKGSDGTQITKLNLGTTSHSPGMYWHGNDPNSENSKKYGPVYNWATISKCNVCPDGWKIASQDEWNLVLRKWYNDPKAGGAGAPGLTYAGYQLREAGSIWPHNGKATNSTGFSARPGGWVWDGKYYALGSGTAWWAERNHQPLFVKIWNGDGGIWSGLASANDIMYVRCMKNCTSTDCDSPDDKKYVVEMLGRQGTLEFPAPIAAKPSTATLSLPINNKATKFLITDGSWDNGVLTAKIMQGDNPSAPAKLPGTSFNKIKLKPTTGTYQLIGAVSYSTSSTSWTTGNTVILGYKNKKTTPKSTARPLFALVVNDKHAENINGGYDPGYGWYLSPKETTTSNFRMVHIVKDDVLNEAALYAFENNDKRTESELPQYKIASYKSKEIVDQLNTIFSGVYQSQIISDLGALLINQAQLKYPSKHLGFKSEGHGSPEGIMNGFFNEDYAIKMSLESIKDLRGSNISFLDFATNCNVASLFNLSNVAPYVDYVLASDMTRTSAPMPFDLWKKLPDVNYAGYFNDESKSVRDILIAMVDKYGTEFNSQESKDYAKTEKGKDKLSKQQLTLFDMAKFPKILGNIGGDEAYETCKKMVKEKSMEVESLYYNDGDTKYLDFKMAIPVLFPQYTSFTQDWQNFAIRQMSNRGEYQWETDLPKGMTITRKWD